MDAEYKNHVIKFADKEETKQIRWLQNALSTDAARPQLTCIRVENGHTVATDGFRMHIIETPATLADYQDKNLHPDSKKIAVNPRPEEFCEYPQKFPEWQQIRDPLDKKEPVFKIAMSPKLLADLVGMTDSDTVVLTFFGSHDPVLVKAPQDSDNGNEAVIMPKLVDETKLYK